MTLLRPVGITFPGAVATTSTWLKLAQTSEVTNSTIKVAPMALPVGEGGDSTISKAAGKKAYSSRSRGARVGNGMIFSAGLMKALPTVDCECRLACPDNSALDVQ